MNNIRNLAELLRKQGGNEDTVLAHINPIEAEWLEEMGGSGEINPTTGLPQYGWGLGAALGGLAGTFVGAPMLGAFLGGGVGGGRKKKRNNGVEYEYADETENGGTGFLSKLGSKTSDFLSDPSNLLALGSTAAQAFSRSKKQRALTPEEEGNNYLRKMMASGLSPEDSAALEKRAIKANRMSPEEMREAMMYKQALERAEWEARNNLAPGETLDIDPIYRKENDEDEFKKTGRWFEYYNDPEFKGKRVYMARGGEVKHPEEGFMEVSISTKPSLSDILRQFSGGDLVSGYIDGDEGGQDDTISAKLSAGEYVIDAETVSHLGDGNSKNGAKKLDEFVKRIREHKRSANYNDIAPII